MRTVDSVTTVHHTDVAQSMIPLPTMCWTGRSKTSIANAVRSVVKIVVGTRRETGRTWKSIFKLNLDEI